MAIEKAKKYLKQFNAENKIIEFDTSSATVELAAQALGCEPQNIAKSLAFYLNDSAILIVAAGDAKVDNQKFKAEFSTKPKMLKFDDVEAMIGHAVGGVCPFGINEGIMVYLDESLKRFDIVYPAAGSSNSCVKLTLSELEEYSAPQKWVDVCKI